MDKRASAGTCLLCEQTYGRAGMNGHLRACLRKTRLRALAGGEESLAFERGRTARRAYHIAVEGRYDPRYWMHLEMPLTMDLNELDRFLRSVWLECCGHLSAFRISGVKYQAGGVDLLGPFGVPAETMRHPAHRVLGPGQRFTYDYNFGTTTELALRVVSERATGPDKGIRVLAVNDPPELACHACGAAQAVTICTECAMRSFPDPVLGLLCDDCDAAHGCDDMVYLPVVNSPRIGMCGYAG